MNPRPLFLGGSWQKTETSIDVFNPSTGEVFDQVCTVDRAAVAQAVSDAHDALPGWRALTGSQRGNYLRKIADILEERTKEIARLITLENGKPFAQSAGEVGMSVDHLRWFAEEARRAYGRIVPQQVEGKRHLVIKRPIGVVGAIGPWNFPLVLAIRKIAPALAAGCPVILKPASATPLCTIAFAECVEQAELPRNVFQLVLGRASEIAAEFLDNPKCRKISFTGSTEVGKKLIEGAAAGVKPLSLELGGNAPLLVFEDADMNTAVEGALGAKFRNTGQSCIAANRVYVQRSIYDEFLDKFCEKALNLRTGDGFLDGVNVGPLIDEQSLGQALKFIEDAVNQGARLLCGGKRYGDQGWFLEPTVLADAPAAAACMNEEVFAPIAPVVPFDDEEEAINAANSTQYGLSAYAFTTDLGRTFRLMEALEAGTIGINDGAPTTSQCPFGGCKQSGWGRELGVEGMEAFLETKHVCVDIT